MKRVIEKILFFGIGSALTSARPPYIFPFARRHSAHSSATVGSAEAKGPQWPSSVSLDYHLFLRSLSPNSFASASSLGLNVNLSSFSKQKKRLIDRHRHANDLPQAPSIAHWPKKPSIATDPYPLHHSSTSLSFSLFLTHSLSFFANISTFGLPLFSRRMSTSPLLHKKI
jgi:hypothetical protein